MKLYYKLLEKIKNNKTRVKNGISIISFAVGLRYCRINSYTTNLSSNSTQQVEQVYEALKYTLEIRSGSAEGLPVDGFGINPPMSRPSYSQSLTSQRFGTKTSLDNDSPDSDDSDTSSSSYSNFEYLDQSLSETLSNEFIG